MKVYYWLLPIVLSFGCGTVRPMVPGPHARLPSPVLPEALVHGPIVQGVRVTGFSNFNYGAGSAAAVANSYSGAAAASSVAVRSRSASFEYYESDSVEQFLVKLLEDSGTITKIHPRAKIELKGLGGVPESAAGWKGVWNFFAVLSLTAYLGMPMYWEAASAVELRMYKDHEFLGSYRGDGRCYAVGTLYYFWYEGITFVGGRDGGSLGSCAVASAVGNSVLKLQEDPPTIPGLHAAPSSFKRPVEGTR
jgi:hypothetical protein